MAIATSALSASTSATHSCTHRTDNARVMRRVCACHAAQSPQLYRQAERRDEAGKATQKTPQASQSRWRRVDAALTLRSWTSCWSVTPKLRCRATVTTVDEELTRQPHGDGRGMGARVWWGGGSTCVREVGGMPT